MAANAIASDVYSTGFEAPTFAVGPLAGQDGWSANFTPANVTVQNSVSFDGSQAIQIDANGAAGFTRAVRFDTIFGLVETSAHMRFSSSGTTSAWRLDAYRSSDGQGYARIIIKEDDSINVFGGSTGYSIARDTWHHFRMISDFAAGT